MSLELRRYWPWIGAIAVLWILHRLTPVLAPFLIAAILAYILAPLVALLQARRWPRSLAVTTVLGAIMLLSATLAVIIVPLFSEQVMELVHYIPALLAWLRDTAAPFLSHRLGITIPIDVEHLRAWLTAHSDMAGNFAESLLPSLTSRGRALVGFLASALLLPVAAFYLLRDWPLLVAKLVHLIPLRWLPAVSELITEVDAVLGQYLRGQLSVILIMVSIYSVGLLCCGLHSGLPIGVVAGILVFIPYLGVIVGVLLATLAAMLQFHSLIGVLPVWGLFMFGQFIEGFYVTPRLVGERIGLHPLAVIFALLAFGELFGFIGVLLALPMAAVTLVAIMRMHRRYISSDWYLQTPTRP